MPVITPARPASESKTLQAVEKSNQVQTLALGIGLAVIVGWFVAPSEFRQRIADKALPVISSTIPAFGLYTKWINRTIKANRINAGDLITAIGEIGPNPGDIAAMVALNKEELQRFKGLEGAIAGFTPLQKITPIAAEQQMHEKIRQMQSSRTSKGQATEIPSLFENLQPERYLT